MQELRIRASKDDDFALSYLLLEQRNKIIKWPYDEIDSGIEEIKRLGVDPFEEDAKQSKNPKTSNDYSEIKNRVRNTIKSMGKLADAAETHQKIIQAVSFSLNAIDNLEVKNPEFDGDLAKLKSVYKCILNTILFLEHQYCYTKHPIIADNNH